MSGSLIDQTAGSPARETRRSWTLAALMMAMFMGAIEATIVATAIPTIVGDLGGFALLTWVFSAYLLTQAASIPIYGKLADLYGRKPIFLVGTSIFAFGSLLSGLAGSMAFLVFARAVQGLGAGAVLPMASTIVGDLYDLEERARIQGYLASVWGISSVVGPTAGGLIVTYLGWPWIFFVNLPIALMAVGLIVLNFHESVRPKERSIDYLGAALIFATVGALITFLVQGGVAWEWSDPPSLALVGIVLAGALAFVRQERTAAAPVLPLSIFRRPVIAVGNTGAFLAGALVLGTSSFIPTFVQGSLGQTAIVAGLSLGAMSVGWPLASTFSGRIMIRIGFRKTAVIGSLFNVAGALVLLMLSLVSSPWHVAAGTFLMGVGLGLTTTTYLISIQHSVAWEERGVATGSNMFGRMLGSTIGVAVLGSLLNGRLGAYVQRNGDATLQRLGADAGNALLDPARRALLSAEEVSILQEGLAVATHSVFTALLVIAAIVSLVVWFLPDRTDAPTNPSESGT